MLVALLAAACMPVGGLDTDRAATSPGIAPATPADCTFARTLGRGDVRGLRALC